MGPLGRAQCGHALYRLAFRVVRGAEAPGSRGADFGASVGVASRRFWGLSR